MEPYVELIEKYYGDGDETIFYIDPPYHAATLNKRFIKSDYYHDFDIIENIDEGMEVIWTRYDGSVESLEWMQVSEEDRLLWVTKRTEREMWLNIKEEIYKATCKARLIQASDDARQKLLDESIKKIVNEHQIDYSIISV